MALQYPGDWKFDGVGFGVPPFAVADFLNLLTTIAEDSWPLIESFKASFGRTYRSSSFSFAVGDLETAMQNQAGNAAAFVDALWKSIEVAKEEGAKTPSHHTVNKYLERHHIPLRVNPPHLELTADGSVVDGGQPVASEAVTRMSFTLGDIVGSGGYGTVYRATRETSVATFEYAVKLLDPSPFVDNVEKARERFAREVTLLSSLQHRAIVTLIDAGVTSERKAYIAMPFIHGQDLRTACQTLEVSAVLDVFIEILRGLQAAHAAHIIHRDLKPTNIIVRSSDSQPIIVDFGAAYKLDDLDANTLTTAAVGTLGYIPSEVIANPKLRSPRQDVYACGVMLYEVFAGRKPDPSNYLPLGDVRAELAELDVIIRGAIAGETTRTASAEAFALQLETVKARRRGTDR
jgi:hypothetical protein